MFLSFYTCTIYFSIPVLSIFLSIFLSVFVSMHLESTKLTTVTCHARNEMGYSETTHVITGTIITINHVRLTYLANLLSIGGG